MIIGFWSCTLLLLMLSFGFVLPCLGSRLGSYFVILGLTVSSYGLYLQWGSSQQLKQYYSAKQQVLRSQQGELQHLFSEFTKTEYRLRFSLEEDPEDKEVKQQLSELLRVKALLGVGSQDLK